MPRVARDPPCPAKRMYCKQMALVPSSRRTSFEGNSRVPPCALQEKCRINSYFEDAGDADAESNP